MREAFWESQFPYIKEIFPPIFIGVAIFLAALVVLFIFGLFRLYSLLRFSKKDVTLSSICRALIGPQWAGEWGGKVYGLWTRLRTTLGVVCLHLRILSEAYPGWMHFLIFWGVALLLAGKITRLFSYTVVLSNPPQSVFLYASLVSEVGAAMILVGGGMALYRRYVKKPSRLDTLPDDTLVFVWAILIILTGFMVKGFRMAAAEVDPVDWYMWAPLSFVLSHAFLIFSDTFKNYILVWHRVVMHTLPVMVFFVYIFISRSRIQHLWISPLNIFFRRLGPKGVLAPIDIEKAESFGASRIEHFSPKHLLDLMACTRCGRCQDNCPANISGKPLSPKKVIVDLKAHLIQQVPLMVSFQPGSKQAERNPTQDMIHEVITDEVLWECTTCRACQQACPVYIEHVPKIIEMRRSLVLEQSQMPETAAGALKSVEARGHPWRGTLATRMDWAKGIEVKVLSDSKDVDIVYWVGCTAALEERSMKVAASFARLMKSAGVNFGILGAEESCCGEPARRMGNEYLFQMQAQKNIELMKAYGVKKIVTSCPHCYNMIRHEYPQFGGEFEIIHHSQLLWELIGQGKIKMTKELTRKMVYHDACYLGRYNDIFDEPRNVLAKVPGASLAEMDRRLYRSFCCGAGGGRMWMEERIGKRINEVRTEEAIKTGAEIIATACPYCLQMFVDGIKTKGAEETVKPMDLAEVIEAAQ